MLVYIKYCTLILTFTETVSVVLGGAVEDAALKRLQCSLGLRHDDDCPVDGGWSPWEPWSACQGECGQVGRRLRVRNCTNPIPDYGGTPCQGDDTESDPCQMEGCTADQYRQLVAGDILRAGQFAVLELVHRTFPALSDRCLVNHCNYQTAETIMHNSTTEYWNALQCVKHNIGCPLNGQWSTWCNWSSCSATCGEGLRYHRRTCTNPAPTAPELLTCCGPNFETHHCTGDNCAPIQDGQWTDWGPWSACSAVCGPGIMRRERDCKQKTEHQGVTVNMITDVTDTAKPKVLTLSSFCLGPSEEIAPCEIKNCSVDGGWSTWEGWQPCSAQCGVGTRIRSRSCSRPTPSYGGKNCSGDITQKQHCFKRPCLVKKLQATTFAGDGSLLYSPIGISSRLLLLYLRFCPQSPNGVLIVRYQEDCYTWGCDSVSLVLEGGFLVISAYLKGCLATTMSNEKLEMDNWHVALITVTSSSVTLRVDDGFQREKAEFSCIPVMPELDQSMRVGDQFIGQIQHLAINYNPILLYLSQDSSDTQTGIAPNVANNVQYEMTNEAEGCHQFKGKEFIYTHCPFNELWQVELCIQPAKTDVLVLYMPGGPTEDYVLLTLEVGVVRLRVRRGEYHVEAESSKEVTPDSWLHLSLSFTGILISLLVNGEPITIPVQESDLAVQCAGEMMIGGASAEIKKQVEALEALRSKTNASGVALHGLVGTLALLTVDGVNKDLARIPSQREDTYQFSSYTASHGELYEEVPVQLGDALNLTCFYGQEKFAASTKASWLQLDQPVERIDLPPSTLYPSNASYFLLEKGNRLLRLTAVTYPSRVSIEGFYGCWVVRQDSREDGLIFIGIGVTVIDMATEYNNKLLIAFVIIAAIALFACILIPLLCILQLKRERNQKFGLYADIIGGQTLLPSEQMNYIQQFTCSPLGQVILGSNSALMKSEEQLKTFYNENLLSDKHRRDSKNQELPQSEHEEIALSAFPQERGDHHSITYEPEFSQKEISLTYREWRTSNRQPRKKMPPRYHKRAEESCPLLKDNDEKCVSDHFITFGSIKSEVSDAHSSINQQMIPQLDSDINELGVFKTFQNNKPLMDSAGDTTDISILKSHQRLTGTDAEMSNDSESQQRTRQPILSRMNMDRTPEDNKTIKTNHKFLKSMLSGINSDSSMSENWKTVERDQQTIQPMISILDLDRNNLKSCKMFVSNPNHMQPKYSRENLDSNMPEGWKTVESNKKSRQSVHSRKDLDCTMSEDWTTEDNNTKSTKCVQSMDSRNDLDSNIPKVLRTVENNNKSIQSTHSRKDLDSNMPKGLNRFDNDQPSMQSLSNTMHLINNIPEGRKTVESMKPMQNKMYLDNNIPDDQKAVENYNILKNTSGTRRCMSSNIVDTQETVEINKQSKQPTLSKFDLDSNMSGRRVENDQKTKESIHTRVDLDSNVQKGLKTVKCNKKCARDSRMDLSRNIPDGWIEVELNKQSTESMHSRKNLDRNTPEEWKTVESNKHSKQSVHSRRDMEKHRGEHWKRVDNNEQQDIKPMLTRMDCDCNTPEKHTITEHSRKTRKLMLCEKHSHIYTLDSQTSAENYENSMQSKPPKVHKNKNMHADNQEYVQPNRSRTDFTNISERIAKFEKRCKSSQPMHNRMHLDRNMLEHKRRIQHDQYSKRINPFIMEQINRPFLKPKRLETIQEASSSSDRDS